MEWKASRQKPGFNDHAQTESTVNSAPGGMVSIQCSVHPGGRVLWYKQDENGKMEVAHDSFLILSDSRFQLKSDNGAYILTIQPTAEEDSGIYMCESSDQHGSTYKHTFTLASTNSPDALFLAGEGTGQRDDSRAIRSPGQRADSRAIRSPGQRADSRAIRSPGQRADSRAIRSPAQRDDSRAIRSPGQRADSRAIRSPGQRADSRAIRSPGQRDDSRAIRSPGQRDDSRAIRSPGQRADSRAIRSPGQRDDSRAIRSPGQRADSRAIRSPGQRDDSRAIRSPAQRDDSRAIRSPGQRDDSRHYLGDPPVRYTATTSGKSAGNLCWCQKTDHPGSWASYINQFACQKGPGEQPDETEAHTKQEEEDQSLPKGERKGARSLRC
ncbi:Sialidase [Amphibalanus amphitrite]|uniref:Sialidase n=1 Tax=Amphibalanus amphitrite TaxID=1232801 RepID=A0A6A4WG06_AMPAM|nr:Sialidase [Amphibalanus amphitrite]